MPPITSENAKRIAEAMEKAGLTNDPYPTEDERIEHQEFLAQLRQECAADWRKLDMDRLKQEMREFDERRAACAAGEAYVEPGEPI